MSDSDNELHRSLGRIEGQLTSIQTLITSQNDALNRLATRVTVLESARTRTIGWIAGASAVWTVVAGGAYALWKEFTR